MMIYAIFFLAWPLIEIWLFAWVGSEIGALSTLMLFILSAMAGSYLLQHQGLQTTASIRQSLDRGEMPVDNMFDGICRFMAGVLLIIPGFLSDGIAVLLLIPIFRGLLRKHLTRFFIGEPIVFRSTVRREDSIDAEFVRMDDPAPDDENTPKRLR